jgi:hypothetical protein
MEVGAIGAGGSAGVNAIKPAAGSHGSHPEHPGGILVLDVAPREPEGGLRCDEVVNYQRV